jgi:hypothetical protein
VVGPGLVGGAGEGADGVDHVVGGDGEAAGLGDDRRQALVDEAGPALGDEPGPSAPVTMSWRISSAIWR